MLTGDTSFTGSDMKAQLQVVLGLVLASMAGAQIVIPATPGSTKTRPIGGGTSGGVEVVPKANPKIRYTTHIILSVSRFWTSNDGKLLEGKLIAFEDMVVEAAKGAPPPTPEPPKHPTVVKGDKVRLLVNKKPVEVAVSRLSQGDREFIEQTRKSYEAKTPPNP